MQRLRDDLRFAFRALRRAPAFCMTAVAILALGIGATSAVFSVASTVLVRSLPVRDQNRVITLWAKGAGAATEVPTMLDRYQRFRASTRTLAGVAGFAHYGSSMAPLEYGDSPIHAHEAVVTGNFFDVLGTRPVIGRLLRPEDDVAGAAPVMVISEAYWRATLGADPSVIGRRVRMLNRETTATVVGIAPAGLEYPSGADYWIAIVPAKYPAVDLVARLAPGASLAQARAEFTAFIDNDSRAFPTGVGAQSLRAIGTEAHTLPDVMLGDARQPLIILTFAVAALLLIACVNVGNLLLVRATGRTREIAVRRALGAPTSRIVSHLASEVLLLAAGGAILGTATAVLLLRILIIAAPPGLPRLSEVAISPAAVAIATVATCLALLAAGVLPVINSGTGVSTTLRSDSRGGAESRGRRTLRSVLVSSQIALALVLLAFASLLGRSLWRLEGINLGYVPAHLSIVQITAPFHKYTSRQQFNDSFDAARGAMRAVPGVSAVTPLLALPFIGSNVFATRIEVRDRTELNGSDSPYVSWDAVGPEFSAAMDVPIVRGRGIWDSDRADAPRVAVVTQDLANHYWPGEDPLGKQLRFAGVAADTAWRTIVGVVRPLSYRTLQTPTPTVLFSYQQEFQQGIFAVRSSRDLASILPSLRKAAGAGDKDIVLWRAQTMDQILGGPLARPRMETFVLAMFAGVALLLAAVGLYGVTAYVVRQQTREIGVRIALGASPARILRTALGSAVRVGAAGVVLGLLLSLAGGRALSSQLFEVSPGDPVALVVAGGVLLLFILVASYIPARRAARVNPVDALRAD